MMQRVPSRSRAPRTRSMSSLGRWVGKPAPELLGGRVLDRERQYVGLGEDPAAFLKAHLPVAHPLVDLQHLAIALEEELVVQLLAELARERLEDAEVEHPAVVRQLPLHFYDHVVVVAVQWLTRALEGREV